MYLKNWMIKINSSENIISVEKCYEKRDENH